MEGTMEDTFIPYLVQWIVRSYYDITNQYTIKRREISLQTEV